MDRGREGGREGGREAIFKDMEKNGSEGGVRDRR